MNAVPVLAVDGMAAADVAHWETTWAGLGVNPPPRTFLDRVLSRYAERHRAYHTREHLEECFTLLASMHALCEHPHEVALALWFHDVVYAPRRSDNEAVSAQCLVDAARVAGVGEPSIARMHALVMATCHHAPPLQGDASVLVDIDLAILGAPVERFDRYETQIRREYRWVPGPIYRSGRARVLRSFLDRPAIYTTAICRDRFEAAARANIERSLAALASR